MRSSVGPKKAVADVPAFVLDCAFVLRWLLKEDDGSSSIDILERVAMHGAIVPGIWPLEIANVLVTKAQAKRLPADSVKRLLADVGELRIEVDRRTNEFAWTRIVSLAQRHRLTSYDAAYLELAARHNLALATIDKDLRKAAEAEGVLVLPK